MSICRGVKGATTVEENSQEAIYTATTELLEAMVLHNQIEPDDIASIWFTTTVDLNAAFPAAVAREHFNWQQVPLMCAHEMNVPGGLEKCVRVLLHWNTRKTAKEIAHIYLHNAKQLRLDLNKS